MSSPIDPRAVEAALPGTAAPAARAEFDRRAGVLERAGYSTKGWVPGDLKMSARAVPDSGWLLCDGSLVNRTEYAGLFAAIGTAFGAGDGVTTFQLPDMRGRVPVGKGSHAEVDALGDSDGLAVGSRKVKHRHGRGTLGISRVGSVGGNTSNVARGTGPTDLMDGSVFSGEIGDTSGPLDGPAYQVVNIFIKT